jgi:hypothetical protein
VGTAISSLTGNVAYWPETIKAAPGLREYRAQIVESEMRVTRNGIGQFLWLMLNILDADHKGRRNFDQLNLVNARRSRGARRRRWPSRRPVVCDWEV